MHSLVYRSVANNSFGLPEIYKMLSKAKDYNAEHNITGCLLYHKHQFLQLLEGEKEKLDFLYSRILEDHRHQDIVLIENEESEYRIFPDWSMAFHDYGLNGHSGSLKLKQIELFLNKSNMFTTKSVSAIRFFSNVKEILV